MRTPHLLAGTCAIDDPDAGYRHAELAVWDEVQLTLVAYPRVWGSDEEGAMLLGEEIDELWDEVRRNQIGRARAEAAQVGAMAIRFIADRCAGAGGHAARCRVATGHQRRVRQTVGPRRVLVSSHEAFGFLKREYDALWAAVIAGADPRDPAARVAAAAVRFIAEIHTSARPVRAVR